MILKIHQLSSISQKSFLQLNYCIQRPQILRISQSLREWKKNQNSFINETKFLVQHQEMHNCILSQIQTRPRFKVENIVLSQKKFYTGHNVSSNNANDNDGHLTKSKKTSDNFIEIPGLLDQLLPVSLLPYAKIMRLDKPIGVMLLLYPCLWSISLAAQPGCNPNIDIITLFCTGAVLMRSAGCIVNDMLDRDIDKKVSRTLVRPLATGQMKMVEAWALLAACLTASLHVLLSFDNYTIMYGASSLALVITYPLMKRITFWPQAFLGLTFNWGAMLGWSAVTGGIIDWSIVGPLYMAGICWTLVYDTIYAYQDIVHDKKIGIKSTAIRFGDNHKKWLGAFSTGMITNLLLTGVIAEQTWPYYVAVGLSAARIAEIVLRLDTKNTKDCGDRFRKCQQIGLLMLLGIWVGNHFKERTEKNQTSQTQILKT